MRILFITQYFYPEIFRGNDAILYLAGKGFKITVITAVPNYPNGRIFKGYGYFKNNVEILNGIKIIRVPVILRGQSGKVRLSLNYLSYAFIASIYAFFNCIFRDYDLVFAQQLSPATSVLPALIVKRVRKIPLLLWVLDLWPESIQAAGGINTNIILKPLNSFIKHVYKRSDKILISSKGFESSICSKGATGDKIIYFPNWAENLSSDQLITLPGIPEGFRIMYAGNIGEAQDFESVVNAIQLLKSNPNIKFIIIGDGRKYDWLERFVNENGLSKTVILMGKFPASSMASFFNQADVMLLSLKDNIVFSKTVPAKLQAYMASGKPVVAMINGDGAEIIADSKCGFVAPAGDYKSLADNILKISCLPKQSLIEMGQAGKLYSEKHFNRETCLSNLEEIISDLVKRPVKTI